MSFVLTLKQFAVSSPAGVSKQLYGACLPFGCNLQYQIILFLCESLMNMYLLVFFQANNIKMLSVSKHQRE